MSQHNAYMTKINILSIRNKEFSQLDVCFNLFIFILNFKSLCIHAYLLYIQSHLMYTCIQQYRHIGFYILGNYSEVHIFIYLVLVIVVFQFALKIIITLMYRYVPHRRDKWSIESSPW